MQTIDICKTEGLAPKYISRNKCYVYKSIQINMITLYYVHTFIYWKYLPSANIKFMSIHLK